MGTRTVVGLRGAPLLFVTLIAMLPTDERAGAERGGLKTPMTPAAGIGTAGGAWKVERRFRMVG